MKLLLASEGFYTDEIATKCAELVGKPKDQISVAVINEGYSVQRDNLRWVLVNLNDVQKHFGGRLELINLLALDLAEIKKRIEEHDVIFVVGGHADYLMNVFEKTGFASMLPELLKTKVYVGSSAGSMIVGKRLPADVYKNFYEQLDQYAVDKYLELVDFSFIAHINSPQFPSRKEDLMRAVRSASKYKIYALKDDSALIIQDSQMQSIGSKPLLLEAH